MGHLAPSLDLKPIEQCTRSFALIYIYAKYLVMFSIFMLNLKWCILLWPNENLMLMDLSIWKWFFCIQPCILYKWMRIHCPKYQIRIMAYILFIVVFPLAYASIYIIGAGPYRVRQQVMTVFTAWKWCLTYTIYHVSCVYIYILNSHKVKYTNLYWVQISQIRDIMPGA